jgi:hypothetical protein
VESNSGRLRRIEPGEVHGSTPWCCIAPTKLKRLHRRRPVTVEVDAALRSRTATTVIIANGQASTAVICTLGHLGDGRVEIQIYASPWRTALMRRRLPSGTHLPHFGSRHVGPIDRGLPAIGLASIDGTP